MLHHLRVGIFAVGKFIFSVLLRTHPVFLEHGERTFRLVRNPLEHRAPRFLIEITFLPRAVVALAGETVAGREPRHFAHENSVRRNLHAARDKARFRQCRRPRREPVQRQAFAGMCQPVTGRHTRQPRGPVAAEQQKRHRRRRAGIVGTQIVRTPVFRAAGRGNVIAVMPIRRRLDEHPLQRELRGTLHFRVARELRQHPHRHQICAVIQWRLVFRRIFGGDLRKGHQQSFSAQRLDLFRIVAGAVFQIRPFLRREPAAAVLHEFIV